MRPFVAHVPRGLLPTTAAILIALVIPFTFVPRAAAATFVVNSAADEADANPGDGTCATSSGKCTLRAASEEMGALPSDDETNVPAGIYSITGTPLWPCNGSCGKDTITGAGRSNTFIDGGNTTQVLSYHGTRLTLASLTIRHSSGPGVYADYGTIEVNDSILTENSVGVSPNFATVTLTNTEISHNGTGIEFGGNEMFSANVTMSGGSVSDNDSAGIDTDVGNLKLTGVTLTGNGDCALKGGNIGASNVAITDCSIKNNLCGIDVTYTRFGNTVTVSRTEIADNSGVGIVVGLAFLPSSLTVIDSTIDGNHGGGIIGITDQFRQRPTMVSLRNTTVSNNSTVGSGGGVNISPFSTLTAVNSTISGNHADGSGGGIANGGTTALFNVTLADNSADASGGGIADVADAATASATNTIIANNTGAGDAPADCAGTLASGGFNLIGTASGCTITGTTTGNAIGQDPALGPLADNGGPTFTHALLLGGPAIDAGDPAGCRDDQAVLLTTDQRGVARPQNARCDIGAYETACGNGVVDEGETCDTGGPTACCSATCQLIPDGSPCQDGNACTSSDSCENGACLAGAPTSCPACESCNDSLGCVAAPRTGCHASTARFSGDLQIVDKTKDRLVWSWDKGDATTLADFGDPLGGNAYRLCLYAESAATPSLAFRAVTRTGRCGSRPCWNRSGSKAFRYKDATQTPDGLDAVLLKSGPTGKAKILVTAKGQNLHLPPLPLALPLRMQLQAENGQCWEAQYFALSTARNDAREFKGRAFAP